MEKSLLNTRSKEIERIKEEAEKGARIELEEAKKITGKARKSVEEMLMARTEILDFLKQLNTHLENISEEHYPPNLHAKMLAYIVYYEALRKTMINSS